MPLPAVHHAFLQRPTQQGCDEVSFVDGRASALRTRRTELPRVIRRGGPLEAFRNGAGVVLKNGARLVYLSPLLLVVKIVLSVLDNPAADLVIVVFVGIVCLFFLLLNFYIVVSVIWWLGGRNNASFALEAPFRDDGREAKPLLPSGAQENEKTPVDLGATPMPVGQVVRARGVVKQLGPNPEGDGTIVRDAWLRDGSFRLLEAIDFAVVGSGRLPAVVRMTDAPMVVANPTVTPLSSYTSGASKDTMRLAAQGGLDAMQASEAECSILMLREGDEVEVVGTVVAGIDNVDGFELEGTYASVPLRSAGTFDTGTPFRDRPGGPGVILGGPIAIRLTPARA